MAEDLVAARRNHNLTIEPQAATPQPERPTPVIERLHALVRKGYRPELGADHDQDAVVLRHRGRAPDLLLHADGVVEEVPGRRPFYKRDVALPAAIGASGAEAQVAFLQLLDTVPRLSLRDRTRKLRHRFVYLPVIIAITWGACIALTAAVLSGLFD